MNEHTSVSEVQEVPEERLTSWNDFKSNYLHRLYSKKGFTRDRFLFRGQGESTWKLESAFDRKFPIAKYDKGVRVRLYQQMLDLYKNRLADSKVEQHVLDDEWLLTSHGQHHGLPTRLLDWSGSPYFAAYFAFSSYIENFKKGDVAIYVLDCESAIWNKEYGVEIKDVAPRGNTRLRVQQGKFTLQRTPEPTLDAYVYRHEDPNALRKVILPAHEARRVIADLDSMGINHDSVYQDVDGVGKASFFHILYNNPSVDLMALYEDEMSKILGEETLADTASIQPTTPKLHQDDRCVLVVVDIQNDFLSGGTLPTSDADALIGPLNDAIKLAEKEGFLIIYTQDWHPVDHSSFKENGGTWPTHCVMGTNGADLSQDLYIAQDSHKVQIGIAPESDGYSPFENSTMDGLISQYKITDMYVTGIALEYCVLATLKHARKRQLPVKAVKNLIKAASPERQDETWTKVENIGVEVIDDFASAISSDTARLRAPKGRRKKAKRS